MKQNLTGMENIMKTIIELMTDEFKKAFAECGYSEEYARITISNRPDLCEFQCNGAMAAANTYKKAPFVNADEIVAKLTSNGMFDTIESVKPGFINIKVSAGYLSDYLNKMSEDDKYGYENSEEAKTVIVDYGGANAAKPLHVGHLRSAVIGESVKRINRYAGNNTIGDVHLGDWGLQMGLIIEELRDRKPELPYFDENFKGEYPAEAPFTISELEEIYPTASGKAKEDEEYRERALHATYLLQNGHKGYTAIWNHIMHVSVNDLKKNYANLNVDFDLWKGESDAQAYIPDMIERLKKEYPLSDCTLDYEHAWQLLVEVRLAAQCTDARVNVVVQDLFAKYPNVAALAAAEPEEIEEIVRPCGLGRSKARDISACMRMLRDKYDCNVPDDFDALLELPGVGRKSANLIMGDVFGKPAIVTDTHCIRLCNRIGLVDNVKEPAKVERELWKIIPPAEGNGFCHRLVDHGRAVCTARTKPYCDKCCLADVCRARKEFLHE